MNNELELRSHNISRKMSTAPNEMRPYGPPPLFRGKADEDLEDWIRFYERYAAALNWSDTQKANNLVFTMEDEARRWYSSVLRETSATRPLETWQQWKEALRQVFAEEHVQDWAYIQLQERWQQPGETPREYVSSVLHLCSRANTAMTDMEKVRCLLRELRSEMMERVAITNPRAPTDFLAHLQRLTHVGAMAQHALAAMPTHALPGFVASSPFFEERDSRERRSVYAEQRSREGNRQQGAPPPETVTKEMFGALQDSVKALTDAVERLSRPPPRRFPPLQSRNQSGQLLCYACGRAGHMMRQCKQPPREDNAPSYRQGQRN